MAEKIFGFKENGAKVEVPAKADLENLDGLGAGYITLDESSPAYVGLSNDGNELLCFNAWQLEPGLYNVTDNIRLYYATADSHDYHIPLSPFAYFDTITVIGPKFGEMRVYAKGSGVTELFLSGSQGIYYIGMMNLTESAGVGTFEDGSNIIMGSYDSPIPEVIDDVTTVSSLSALSAYQGKLLNDKIEELANNAGGGVIDVTELPEITEENKNQILRYNGELYAAGLGYTDQVYSNDEVTFDLRLNENEVAYFDFSKLVPFIDYSCFPQFTMAGNTWADTSTPYILYSCRYTDPYDDTVEVLYEIIVKQSSKYNIIVGEAINQAYDEAFPIAEYSYNQGIIQGSLVYNNKGNSTRNMGSYPYGIFDKTEVIYHITAHGNTPAHGIINSMSLRKTALVWKKLDEDIEYNTKIESIHEDDGDKIEYFYLQHGDVCSKVPYHTSQSMWSIFCDEGQWPCLSPLRSSNVFYTDWETNGIVIDHNIFGNSEYLYRIAKVNMYDRIIPNHIYHVELIGNEVNNLFLIKKLSDYFTGSEYQFSSSHFDAILSDFDGKVGFILNDIGQKMICGINSYWGDIIQVSSQIPYGYGDSSSYRQLTFIWDRSNHHYCVFASNTSGSWVTSRYSETLEADTSMQDPS